MANNKNTIVIYADWIKKFEALSDDEAGKLIKHFFRYVNDLNPTPPDRITELLFIDIENTLKRDLKKWEKRAERSRENGKNGGRPKNPEEPKKTQQVILEPKKPDSVTDSVSVTDSDILLKKETKEDYINPVSFCFKKSLSKSGADEKYINEWLRVRKNKKLTNSETAFTKFMNQVEKSGYTVNEVLEKCIEKSWGGFEAEWHRKDAQNDTIQKYNCEFKSAFGKFDRKGMTEKEIEEFTRTGYNKLISKTAV